MPHIKISATLDALPGKADELRELLVGMAPHCRAEPKNLHWNIWQDPGTAGRYVLDELYVDQSGVVDHRATPHYQNYVSRIGELAHREAAVLTPLDVVDGRS